MTTHPPAMHVLIWRDPASGGGAGPLFGWHEFHSRGGGMFQRHSNNPGWIGEMAKRVLCDDFGAVMRNTNVTVAWQPENPQGRSAATLEPIFRELQPMVLICPARRHGSDWAISCVIVSAGSVQRTIDAMVPEMFPESRPHGIQFQPRGMMLRHDISAEEMGKRASPTMTTRKK
jgi:hypothetical protein